MQSTFSPLCFIEIYPLEGGQWFISGQQLIKCSVTKSLKESSGTFQIELPPGGPNGTNVGPTWIEILTPMSFTMIGMARGTRRNLVMLGVVLRVTEREIWQPAKPVTRITIVEGQDLSKFFLMENWLAVTFLGGYTASAIGSLTNYGGGEAGLSGLSPALYFGGPDDIGKAWYNQIMIKILAKTYIKYKGQNINFPDFMSTWFEKYTDASIPVSEYLIPTEAVWLAKFRQLMAFPWFEVFYNTAPDTFYPSASGGRTFTMQTLQVSAKPYFVCRVNPLPYVPATVSGFNVKYENLSVERWNSLTQFQADSSYIESDFSFSEQDVRNYYALIPSFYMNLFGQSNDPQISPLMYQTTASTDLGSVVRYGYRPAIMQTTWFADPQGVAAQQGEIKVFDVYANLVSKLSGYFEPVALMATGTVRFPLSPHMIIGSKLQFIIGKGEPLWTTYIETVSHEFAFGGPSHTTITFSRGLPTSVYNDSNLLKQMHLGNVIRQNGRWQESNGVPTGLIPVQIDNPGVLASYTGADTAYKTPQMK